MTPNPRLRLHGVVLPDGEPRDVYVVDGRFSLTPVAGAQTVADGGYLLPGLVDAHCHVGLGDHGAVDTADEARGHAVLDRDAGALLLRDAGVPVKFQEVYDDPDLPRIIHAGRHIARPKRYQRGFAIEVEPHELVATVEAQARIGDGWVKLVGDWIDRDLGDLAPLWPGDVLAAAIGRAHELGARVAVHTFGEEALPDLVAAGVDSIEHGTGLTADLLDDVVRAGCALVPTTLNVDNFGGIADSATRFPVYADRMRRLGASSLDRLRDAHEAGIPVYVGTDAGSMLPHGLVVDEIIRLTEICLTPEQALAAGSWGARRWLGLPGIEEGAPGDVVAYDADPRADIGVLRAPRRIVVRGKVVR